MNLTEKRQKVIHALSNTTRLNVLEGLREKEMTVTELLNKTKSGQSNLSQHLSCLRDCGLITSRKEGKYIYYSLTTPELNHLLEVIDATVESMHWSPTEDIHCDTYIK